MSENESEENSNKRKKVKQMVKFNQEWKKYEWVRQCGEHHITCTICNNLKISIGHGGENDLIKHMRTVGHKSNIQSSSSLTKLTKFFTSTTSKDDEQVTVSEVAFTYHTVMHSHSYISSDCAGSLFPSMFGDSNIAQKYRCGRTKMSKIVSNVLAPESIKFILENLSGNVPFSICTDASNKGNIKTFPIILRYFTKQKGIQNVLLAFYALDNELSRNIAESIKIKIEQNSLNMKNVSSFCADNAAVNFGKNQSVFTELKKINSNIIPVGCNSHILHNTCKKATNQLKIDIDSIVMKIYNEFSSSTKRTAILKQFFEWAEIEWTEILRHVPTRWLSLLPAVERLISNFEPIKSYFLSQNSISQVLKNFFNDDLSLAYLGFVMNTCTIFQPALKKLQSNSILVLDLYDIMDEVRQSLIDRKKQQFFGSIARTKLLTCDNDTAVKRFQADANLFFDVAISYLEKWFDFGDNNKLTLLKPLRLNEAIEFNSIAKIIKEFNIASVNEDVLFEELHKLNSYILGENANLSTNEKWIGFFRLNDNTENIYKIVSFIFSIPHSNATSERIFSLMTTAWRKERNKLLIQNLEAELMVKENYKMSCKEFRVFLKTENAKGILKKSASNEKY